FRERGEERLELVVEGDQVAILGAELVNSNHALPRGNLERRERHPRLGGRRGRRRRIGFWHGFGHFFFSHLHEMKIRNQRSRTEKRAGPEASTETWLRN